MLTQYNLKMPHAVYGGENAMDNITAIIKARGAVMDAAKLASVLVTDAYGVKELLDNPGMAQKCVPIVLIPTTAGTGAEVTPNAIVAVPEKELKVGIVNENTGQRRYAGTAPAGEQYAPRYRRRRTQAVSGNHVTEKE